MFCVSSFLSCFLDCFISVVLSFFCLFSSFSLPWRMKLDWGPIAKMISPMLELRAQWPDLKNSQPTIIWRWEWSLAGGPTSKWQAWWYNCRVTGLMLQHPSPETIMFCHQLGQRPSFKWWFQCRHIAVREWRPAFKTTSPMPEYPSPETIWTSY